MIEAECTNGNKRIYPKAILEREVEKLNNTKIKDNRFISIKQDWYKKVSFYDDDIKNIDSANDIQDTFEDLMRKTDDELFRIIIDRVQTFNLTLETYLVGNNELNRFKKTSVTLREPLRYPIKESIKKYSEFLK